MCKGIGDRDVGQQKYRKYMDEHKAEQNTNFYPLPVADVVVGSSSRKEKIRKGWRRNRSMGTAGRRARGSRRRRRKTMKGDKERAQ